MPKERSKCLPFFNGSSYYYLNRNVTQIPNKEIKQVTQLTMHNFSAGISSYAEMRELHELIYVMCSLCTWMSCITVL